MPAPNSNTHQSLKEAIARARLLTREMAETQDRIDMLTQTLRLENERLRNSKHLPPEALGRNLGRN